MLARARANGKSGCEVDWYRSRSLKTRIEVLYTLMARSPPGLEAWYTFAYKANHQVLEAGPKEWCPLL